MSKLNQDQELMRNILAKEWHTLYAEEIILVMNYAKEQQAIIDNLKAQLNNMEACYIERKKECEELQGRIEVASSRIRGICRYINEDNPRCVDALAVTVDCELIRIEGYLRGAND